MAYAVGNSTVSSAIDLNTHPRKIDDLSRRIHAPEQHELDAFIGLRIQGRGNPKRPVGSSSAKPRAGARRRCERVTDLDELALGSVQSVSETKAGVIEIALDGEMILITFKPEAKPSATSRIATHDAVVLSCLMLRSSTLRETVNIEIADLALMVEGGKRSLGWFTIMRDGKPRLTARLDASTIRDVGRCIHDQYLRAIEAIGDGPERSIFVRRVAYRLVEAWSDVAAICPDK